MARILKHGADATALPEVDDAVRKTVESIFEQVEREGDAGIRALSAKLDQWEPESSRLTPAQIDEAIARVPARDIEEIRFAQPQLR